MITITNPNQIDSRYDYVFFSAESEDDANAQFIKKYPWCATITAMFRLRKDYYFPVDCKRILEHRKQVTA